MAPLQSSDKRIIRLCESVVNAPIIWKGEYAYFIHPLSDGVPRQTGEMLEEARDIILEMVDWENVDIILGIEAMGIPLAACLSISTGIGSLSFFNLRRRSACSGGHSLSKTVFQRSSTSSRR